MDLPDSNAQTIVLNIISNGLYSLISIPTKLTYTALKNKFSEKLENEDAIDKLVERILEIKDDKNINDLNERAIKRVIDEDKKISVLTKDIKVKKTTSKKTIFQTLIGKGNNIFNNTENY